MAKSRLRLTMGLERVRKPQYASEPGFVADVNRQLRALEDEIMSIMDQIVEVSPEIMVEALEPTFELSQEYCPVQSGDLKKSGYLEVTNRGREPRVEMGYAKGGLPRYAVLVHEKTNIPHKAPTSAKWLQRALQEDARHLLSRLAMKYGEFMGTTPSGGTYLG